MKNLYIILIALLLTNGCKKDKPDYADKPDTHTYHYLTQEQLNKTPYFTNPAFDTLTFLSNANDTLIFAKLKTDTFYHKTSRSDCPDCPIHYSYYQELHKTYQTIKGNGKFEVRHLLLEPNKSNTIYFTFNNYTYGIGDWQIGLKEYVGYIGNYNVNNTTYKEVLQLGNKGSLSYLNQFYGLFYIDDIPNNLNFMLKY